jgi:hypothetical protein
LIDPLNISTAANKLIADKLSIFPSGSKAHYSTV